MMNCTVCGHGLSGPELFRGNLGCVILPASRFFSYRFSGMNCYTPVCVCRLALHGRKCEDIGDIGTARWRAYEDWGTALALAFAAV